MGLVHWNPNSSHLLLPRNHPVLPVHPLLPQQGSHIQAAGLEMKISAMLRTICYQNAPNSIKGGLNLMHPGSAFYPQMQYNVTPQWNYLRNFCTCEVIFSILRGNNSVLDDTMCIAKWVHNKPNTLIIRLDYISMYVQWIHQDWYFTFSVLQ